MIVKWKSGLYKLKGWKWILGKQK